jgi:hypothetical protein
MVKLKRTGHGMVAELTELPTGVTPKPMVKLKPTGHGMAVELTELPTAVARTMVKLKPTGRHGTVAELHVTTHNMLKT